MKIRIKFTKTGTMRFIGHLDLMRYFQKLLRRAGVDIRYSEGFSPHQIMSFATAMGLGMTSEGEYVDIDVLSTESSENMIRRLNDASNGEIRILKYCQIPDDTKSAMSQIAAADYIVSVPVESLRGVFAHEETCPEDISCSEFSKEETNGFLKGKIAEFCSRESVVLLKKTKKSEQEVDIRPLIYCFSLAEEESSPEHYVLTAEEAVSPEIFSVFLRLATGSEQNLKPELVLEAFFRFLGLDVPEEFMLQIHRTEIYGRKEGELLPLSAYGWDIL